MLPVLSLQVMRKLSYILRDERHMTDPDDFAIIKSEKGNRLYRLA
jgi:hypothetical protein